ncbi:putative Membrane Spanning Protein (plasmid) [Bacillus thuringiensis MC28]|uniref:hypothetical protein n=1 Tax=Bacillus cereus TaxID=1396 RepID=UPI00028A573C|nr:hypothetical protein [Bacillus cereus]AFU17100.1 putative Membrane Spanning Protein [Bacillus thuringiensis MC28]
MKATKLVSLAIPILLLVGCAVGDKEFTPKSEQSSKSTMKTVISEKRYPYYICEQLAEFQYKKDLFLINSGKAMKDKEKEKEILKTANEMDKVLDNMEYIKVPDKYKNIHEDIQVGVTDARKATKFIKDASKEDKSNMQEAVLKSTPHLSGVDEEHWNKAIYELGKENNDAYGKALDKLMKEHAE